jgi:hypothetical protein
MNAEAVLNAHFLVWFYHTRLWCIRYIISALILQLKKGCVVGTVNSHADHSLIFLQLKSRAMEDHSMQGFI